MKICVLGIRGFPNVQGGTETHCENLYPLLANKGYNITVFTRTPYIDHSIRDYKGVKLVPIWCPRSKYLEAFLHTFVGVFRARFENPDILHIHAIGPALFVPLAKLLGLRAIVTHHGPDYRRKKWNKVAKTVLKAGEFAAARWADALICITEEIKNAVKTKYGRDSHVIPNGVKIPHIEQGRGILDKLGLEKYKYILTVGRFVPEKGFDVLVQAFRNLNLKEWKLVIVGSAMHEDTYTRDLMKLAAETDNVIIPGFLKKEPLQELYRHAGLFILPSFYEGLPIVLLEAMSYGLLCLVSDIPANREVRLGEKQYFKPGNAEELAKKIAEFKGQLLSLEEKQRQVEYIHRNYNWEKIAEKTGEVYKAAKGKEEGKTI